VSGGGSVQVPSHLIGSPPAGHNKRKQVAGLERLNRCRRRYLQSILSTQRLTFDAGWYDFNTFFLQAHHRDIKLQIFDALCNEDRNSLSGSPHLEWLPETTELPASLLIRRIKRGM